MIRDSSSSSQPQEQVLGGRMGGVKQDMGCISLCASSSSHSPPSPSFSPFLLACWGGLGLPVLICAVPPFHPH